MNAENSVPLTSLSIFDAGLHMLLIYFRSVCEYFSGTLHTSILTKTDNFMTLSDYLTECYKVFLFSQLF
jgi:hypothetical protein